MNWYLLIGVVLGCALLYEIEDDYPFVMWSQPEVVLLIVLATVFFWPLFIICALIRGSTKPPDRWFD